jgi:hypothetical protein
MLEMVFSTQSAQRGYKEDNWSKKMFATLDKAKPDTGNTRGLNLAAVKRTTVKVSTTAVVARATSSRA